MSRIDAALTFALDKIVNTDLYVLEHSDFGKGDIKKCKMSPDAFIQMALQLAYYKVLYSVTQQLLEIDLCLYNGKIWR